MKNMYVKNTKIIAKGEKIKEQKNPRKEEIEKDKTEYAKLKNDRERIDFIAKHLNLE